jgi:hypothetical protein
MDDKLKELYLEITKDKGKPLDFWEITALLEIYGLRDIDAKQEYGFENLFEIARYMEKFKDIKEYPSKSINILENNPNLLKRTFKNYIKGLAFAMPMLVQIFFTLAIGYAVWSGIEMGKTKATVIAMGTFLALIITGGSAQAIGRKGLFYLKQNQQILASDVTKQLLKVAFWIMVAVGIILILFNSFFEILPSYYFWVLIMFYFLLSVLFLNVSVFEMFEDYYTILYFFLFAIVLVYLFHSIVKIQLPEAQFVTLIILNIVFSVYTYKKLKKLKSHSIGEGEMIPRGSVMFYTLIPFYVYGFLYFGFLIGDRIIAWSVNVPQKPYFIWFDVPYELGEDWALIALVILMGVAEVSIYEFMYKINKNITIYKFYQYKEFNSLLSKFYKKFNYLYFVYGIFTILFVYFLVEGIYDFYHPSYLVDFFQSYTPFIYWVSAVSYLFLVHGLINILFIFSFSRQTFAVKATGYALLVNIIVGMILSRSMGLEYAVVGLFVGSIFFWYFSLKYVIKMFKNLEYYYYSAI